VAWRLLQRRSHVLPSSIVPSHPGLCRPHRSRPVLVTRRSSPGKLMMSPNAPSNCPVMVALLVHRQRSPRCSLARCPLFPFFLILLQRAPHADGRRCRDALAAGVALGARLRRHLAVANSSIPGAWPRWCRGSRRTPCYPLTLRTILTMCG